MTDIPIQTHIDNLNGAYIENQNAPINITYQNQKTDSELRRILNILIETKYIDEETSANPTPFEIIDKIDKNRLSDDWKDMINNEYFKYENAISNILNAETLNGVSNKSIFLDMMYDTYREAKKSLELIGKSIEEISEKSSELLDSVIDSYMTFLKTNDEHNNYGDKYLIKVIIIYGFMECKVLENPNR